MRDFSTFQTEEDKLKLTVGEMEHLLNLIDENEAKGNYWGNKNRYWSRSEAIKEKLQKTIRQAKG